MPKIGMPGTLLMWRLGAFRAERQEQHAIGPQLAVSCGTNRGRSICGERLERARRTTFAWSAMLNTN
jgi:hypothetical protein